MNLAQLWKLPVIFACENNGYNEYTHFSEIDRRRHQRAAGGVRHGGRDASTARTSAPVYAAAHRSTSSARAQGEGPAFLLFKTYRYHGHHVGDIARAYYRPKAEEQEWVDERDPITLHRRVADRATASPTSAALDAIQAGADQRRWMRRSSSR